MDNWRTTITVPSVVVFNSHPYFPIFCLSFSSDWKTADGYTYSQSCENILWIYCILPSPWNDAHCTLYSVLCSSPLCVCVCWVHRTLYVFRGVIFRFYALRRNGASVQLLKRAFSTWTMHTSLSTSVFLINNLLPRTAAARNIIKMNLLGSEMEMPNVIRCFIRATDATVYLIIDNE